MSFQVFAIFVFAITVPFVTGLLCIKKIIAGGFVPLFAYITAGMANSVISYCMIIHERPNHITANIYVVVSFLFLIRQFCKWNNGSVRKYLIIASVGLILWLADNLWLNTLDGNNSGFRAVFSFSILFFLVEQISRAVLTNRNSTIRTSIILSCIGLLIHYSFKCYFETLNLFGRSLGADLIIKLNIIMGFVNLMTYALISTAFLCIRTKPKYFYPYWRV